jgi:glycerophosphoryl diester phosphodiesterase
VDRPTTPTERTPLLIAHRAGNCLPRLTEAREVSPDLIEADVHLFGGRLEVRHMKTLGPVRLLWDRKPWRLGNPFARPFLLEDLLAALAPDEEAMLDLKGFDLGMAGAVGDVVETVIPGRAVTVCSRNWQVLPAFRDYPWARVVYSAGSPGQVASVHRRLDLAHGVSVNRELLTPRLVDRLRRDVPLVMTWTVNDPEMWRTFASWGVTGAITDVPAMLWRAVRDDAAV